MKKCLLFIAALIFAPIISMAQYSYDDEQYSDYEKPSWNEVKGSFIIYTEYNFLKKTPLAGVNLCCNIGYIMGNMEIGWSYIPYKNENNHFYYVSLSVGPVIGKKNKFYTQIGAVSWVGINNNDDFITNYWHAKVKTGSNVYLSQTVFLNLELGYIIPYKNDILQSVDMLSLRLGLGFRF